MNFNEQKKEKFKIVVIGVEKAGKSTFINALVKANILPSAPERCTFTSTKLMYSPEDKAHITFYTKEEFNNIFKSMLKDLEYPNAESADFLNTSVEDFERYFESLSESNPSLYKEHLGITNEEIVDILKNKMAIDNILNQSPKEFRGEELTSPDFQVYITGERLANGTLDTSKPRAVKSLEIFSSNLQDLKTAVIDDVPWFDSPTRIHERQTLERLREADAIMLITNVGRNPSLVGTQLNIITKNTDEDGIPLRDKLFVFGNQIDVVNKQDDIERNKTTLINDVLKYKIGNREKVYVGSAYKYLVDNAFISDSDYSCKFDISGGVDEVREGLTNYYKNERFAILKRRIENIKNETIDLRNKLKEQFSEMTDLSAIEGKKNLILLNEVERIKKDLKEELDKIKDDIKNEIYENKYFSNKFREQIENEEHFPELTPELYEKIKREEKLDISEANAPEAVNGEVRKRLYNDYLENFIDLILSITDKEAEKLHKRIVASMADAILKNTTFNKKELEKEIEDFMQKLSSEITHNSGRFLYLIERFSRPVFDGLILRRVLSEDRKEIFIKYQKEFKYLDSYYSNSDNKLLNMMLGVGVDEEFPKKTTKSNHTLVRNKTQRESNDFDIDSILENLKSAKTHEEVRDEIKKDIENLKKVLSKAVIDAVFLELAFLNSLDKETKILIDSFDNRDSENLNEFNHFISSIIKKLKKGEFESINFEIEQNKLKKEIVEELFEIGI